MKPIKLLSPSSQEDFNRVPNSTLALLVSSETTTTSYDRKPHLILKVRIVRMLADNKVRNFCDIPEFDDLTLTARTYPEFDNCPTSWELGYESVYFMELSTLKKKYDTLRKIDEAKEKLRAQWGTATTFGQMVCRLANILGCSDVITYREQPSPHNNHDDNFHLQRHWTPAESVLAIDSTISAFVAEHREKKESDINAA